MSKKLSSIRTVSYVETDAEKEEYEVDDDSSNSVERMQSGRFSMYDLPIQYHEQSLRILGSIKQGPKKSSLGGQQAASAFRFLNPLLLKEVLDVKPTYKFLTKMAIRKLQNDIIKQLKYLYNLEVCTTKETIKLDGLPDRPFSWTREDFYQRRIQQNVVWTDLMLQNISEECLQTQKFKYDIDVLIDYLNLIFEGFLTDDPNFNPQYKIMNKMKALTGFLTIYQDLLQEFRVNDREFAQECNKIVLMSFKKRESRNVYKRLLQEKLNETQFIDPIELRYQLRYHKSKATQAEMKLENTEASYLKQIDDWHKATEREQYCSQCACNALYVDIESFKSQINHFSEKYDKEYEEIDNKIQYNRLTIDKIREQKKFMQEQIVRFQEEIQIMTAKTIAEKAEEDRSALERLAAELTSEKKSKKTDNSKKAKK